MNSAYHFLGSLEWSLYTGLTVIICMLHEVPIKLYHQKYNCTCDKDLIIIVCYLQSYWFVLCIFTNVRRFPKIIFASWRRMRVTLIYDRATYVFDLIFIFIAWSDSLRFGISSQPCNIYRQYYNAEKSWCTTVYRWTISSHHRWYIWLRTICC